MSGVPAASEINNGRRAEPTRAYEQLRSARASLSGHTTGDR